MAKKITCRLQTPADENGERTDMHLVTTSDEVICNPNSPNPMTLTDMLDQLSGVVISDRQPEHACIWAKPVNIK